MNNAAARTTASPYVLFLNDDTTIITARMAYRHAGTRPASGGRRGRRAVVVSEQCHSARRRGAWAFIGNCSHAFKGLPGGRPHYFDFPNLIRNCSAVTGACLLVGAR